MGILLIGSIGYGSKFYLFCKNYLKIVYAFSLLIILSAESSAQSIYTEKGKYSFEAGIAYESTFQNIPQNISAMSYDLGVSLLGYIDVGADYFQTLADAGTSADGVTGFMNFFASKDTDYNLSVDFAITNVNSDTYLLAGISFYSKYSVNANNSVNLFPTLNLGILTTGNLALGFGMQLEKDISKNLGVIFYPGFSAALSLSGGKSSGYTPANGAEVFINVELIAK